MLAGGVALYFGGLIVYLRSLQPSLTPEQRQAMEEDRTSDRKRWDEAKIAGQPSITAPSLHSSAYHHHHHYLTTSLAPPPLASNLTSLPPCAMGCSARRVRVVGQCVAAVSGA